MSGLEIMAVVGCVAAIVSAYHDGSELIQEIKERKRARKALKAQQADETATQDLEISMVRGEGIIQSQYDRDFKRLGQPFAAGDQIAIDTLKDIIIHLQRQVISNLKLAWQQDAYVDFLPLQDVSDNSQDRAIMCLMELHQRLLVAAPITEMTQDFSRMKAAPFATSLPFLEREPQRNSPKSIPFGNHVVISGPSSEGYKRKNRFGPLFRRPSKSLERAVPEVIAQDAPYVPRDFIPPKFSPEDYHELIPGPRSLDDSPTLSPEHLSSISTISSRTSLEADNPEYNPWSTGRTTSQTSNTESSFSRELPKRDPLVPEALSPRRSRPPQAASHSRNTSFATDTLGIHSQQDNSGAGGQELTDPAVDVIDSYGASTASTSSSFQQELSSNQGARYKTHSSIEDWAQLSSPNEKKPAAYTWLPPKPQSRVSERMPPSIDENAQALPQSSSRRLSSQVPPPCLSNHVQQQNGSSQFQPQRPSPKPPMVAARMISHEIPDSKRSKKPIAPISLDGPIVPFEKQPLRRFSTVTSNTSSSGGATGPVNRPVRVVAPVSPGDLRGCLPSESNKFSGFCKGAWRLQIGDRKKAFEERSRPAAMFQQVVSYYKCTKCAFEGRCVLNGKKKSIDTKVYGSNGILYRWEFLFKSHIHLKDALPHPVDSTFGCMFCCAEGLGTPIFGGVASLLTHLQQHRDRQPTGEVLFKMNCVVGRSPSPEEDFDVALPPLVI